MRIRLSAVLPLVLLIVFAAGGSRQSQLSAFTDADRDGIDDGVEMQLATRFLPTIWHSIADLCPNPTPLKILFRLRHPSVQATPYTNFILINYIILYDEDCGSLGHRGDNEPFEVWLVWNGADWAFAGLSATAHYATAAETRTVSTSSNVIWVGNKKHGNYAQRSECGIAWSPDDECSEDLLFLRTLYNVGEPYATMIDSLEAVNYDWRSEAVWNDPNRKFFDAGDIRTQLSHNRFNAPFNPPGWWECISPCDQRLNECINSPTDPYTCYAEHQQCTDYCNGTYRWDDGAHEYTPAPPPPAASIFFDGFNFEGQWFTEPVTDVPFVGWEWNDRISSIFIPSQTTVVLYEHIDFGGASLTLTGPASIPDLRAYAGPGPGGTWNDAASSMRVFSGAPPPPPPAGPTLAPGQSLNPGQAVHSPDGRFTLMYQTDANLVLYRSDGSPMWAINCWPVCVGLPPAGYAIMQTDGNFVVYDAGGSPVWHAGTYGHPGAYLQVQNDGNMVVYDSSGAPLWATGTSG